MRAKFGVLLSLIAIPAFGEPQLSGSPQELRGFFQPDVKTVSISKEVREVTFKDQAVISMSVTTQDDKLSQALSNNAKIREDIARTLIADGIAQKHIKNAKFSTSPDYGWFGDKPDSYKVTNTVTVRIQDESELQSLAAIVDKYQQVSLISTLYEHSDKAAFEQKVLEAALNMVLEEKAFYEKALGIKLAPISFGRQEVYSQEIERIEVSGSRIIDGDESYTESAPQLPTSFEEVTYIGDVTVEFAIVTTQ